MIEKKRWRIEAVHADERAKSGRPLKMVAHRTAIDAGEAWLNFSKRLPGAQWQSITVQEAKDDE